MILEGYLCSSCYFEDKDPSSRIDPAAVSEAQGRVEFKDVLLAFVCVERYDGHPEVGQAVQELCDLSDMLGRRPIVLCPHVHLSMDKAPEAEAVVLLSDLARGLSDAGFKVHPVSFGYHKQFGMDCQGHVGSVVGRRFYGSPERQFLRLLTRLGICPPDVLPSDLPTWAQILTERQLRVLSSRKETYRVAKKMLKDQLDLGVSALWTCMLFEGERQPMEDYLGTLYEIIEGYPDVQIHRAMNLRISGFANAARHLFRKYPEVIESGRLCLYNSTVRDLEFLLTGTEVLLAFPQKPRKLGSYAGEISFGLYCKDEQFAQNMIQWYRTFLVDARFGWIKSEASLDEVISELEEETFQKGAG